MRTNIFIISAVLLCLANAAEAGKVVPAQWTYWGIPDLAVIGTLEDVEENVWVSGFAPTLPPNKIRIIRKFYNSVWIEVESVLEGAVSGTRIPVIWPARTSLLSTCLGCAVHQPRHFMSQRWRTPNLDTLEAPTVRWSVEYLISRAVLE